jgi:hypothetical protein
MAGIGGFATTLGGSVNFTGTNVISEVVSIALPELSMTDIDVSSMASASNYMEFIGGSVDPGQMDLIVNYTPAQRGLSIAAVGDVNETWTLTFPDGSSYATNGYINKNGAGTAGTNEKITSSIGIKCSGVPTHVTGA